jgi:hypothetical protein
MPVRAGALVAADIIPGRDSAPFVKLRGERHLEDGNDRLMVLADIIPIAPIHQVVSFGDLVLGIGTVALIVGLLRPPPRKPWQPD